MDKKHTPSVEEIYAILQYLAHKNPNGIQEKELDGTTVNEIRVKAFTKQKRYVDIRYAIEHVCEGGLVKIQGKGGTGTLYIITSDGYEFYDRLRVVMSTVTSIREKMEFKSSE